MATTEQLPPLGFAAVSRAVVSMAAEVVTGVQRAVVGPDNVRTARDNAWSAILADRARAQARAETSRAVAALVAAGTPSHITSLDRRGTRNARAHAGS